MHAQTVSPISEQSASHPVLTTVEHRSARLRPGIAIPVQPFIAHLLPKADYEARELFPNVIRLTMLPVCR